jgi:hypothetical protein
MQTKCTHNVNGMPVPESIRTAFNTYDMEQRWQAIAPDLSKYTIVAHCEVAHRDIGRYKDYENVFIAPYVPGSDKSQYYAIVSRARADKQYMYWATDTPRTPLNRSTRQCDKTLRDCGVYYEKGIAISIYMGARGVLIDCVVHLDRTRKYQDRCMHMYATEIARLRAKYSTQNPYVLVTGDFNTFPGRVYQSMDPTISLPISLQDPYDPTILRPLEAIGLSRVGPLTPTFRGYPYDFGMPSKDTEAIIKECLEQVSATDPKNHVAIRLLYANAIVKMYGQSLLSLLDHVFTDIPVVNVTTRDMKIPTPVFIYYAAMGHAETSDHSETITNFYIP